MIILSEIKMWNKAFLTTTFGVIRVAIQQLIHSPFPPSGSFVYSCFNYIINSDISGIKKLGPGITNLGFTLLFKSGYRGF